MNFESTGFEIEEVYDSPDANKSSGELMKVNTLFPLRSENGEVKGGVILLKLRKITNTTPSNALIKLTVTYENRNGQKAADEAEAYIPEWDPNIINKTAIPDECYENNGIRNAILISRYVNLMKSWLIEENSNS